MPAEVIGTAAACAGVWLAHRATGWSYAVGFAGSLSEAVGYYGVILWDEARRFRRLGVGAVRAVLRSLPGILVEFGPAELVDTLVVRPLLMATGPLLTGGFLTGTLAGKVASDVVFYAVVLPSWRLRRWLFPDPGASGQPSPHVPGDVSTPYLGIDLDRLRRSLTDLRTALPEAAVHYAMKCNPDRTILRTLHAAGASFEIASGAELVELIAVGAQPAELLFSNPVKVPEHVRAAWAAGVWRFAFDSDAELDKIAALAPAAAVYVRLATSEPGSQVPSEGKFGVSEDEAARLMGRAVEVGLRAYGITFHVGSQMVDPLAWEAAIEGSGRLMRELLASGITITMLDVGGGFPARYDRDNPDLATYAKHIRAALHRLPYPVELVVEPGRALVAEAGTMVASVIGVAQRGARRWAHLDVGAFNGLMESLETGNQLRYPVRDSRRSSAQVLFSLTGPTCDSQDTVMHDVPLSSDLAVGDQIFIQVAGAYTTGYASRFNGFDIPAVHCADRDLVPSMAWLSYGTGCSGGVRPSARSI